MSGERPPRPDDKTIPARPALARVEGAPALLTLGGDGVPPVVGETFGRYHQVREINRGGMGRILTGVDPDTGRDVAIKVLHAGQDADRYAMQKFLNEGRLTAQLEHPNIVPVHEVGVLATGELYFAMQLVRGRSLYEILHDLRAGREADPPWTLTRLLGVFVKVCDAVAYAHARGVVHRDLKPDNLMIGAFGEVLVMDWGIAALRDAAASDSGASWTTAAGPATDASPIQTLEGQVIGTPAYMPPEQAEGRVDRVDERADIYTLGAILYELLTLCAPYEGTSPRAILEQVVSESPPPPSTRAAGNAERGVPRELEAVVLRAMERSRSRRYQTVGALQADIQAYLDGRVISAAHYSLAQRLVKWVGRHRAAALALAVATVTGAGFAGHAWWRGRVALREAVSVADKALAAAPTGATTAAQREAALAAHLTAAAALDRALRLAPQDPALARRRLEIGRALARIAADGQDYGLARQTLRSLVHFGATPEEVESWVEAVELARTREASARLARIEAILDDVAAGLGRPGRPPDAPGLEDYVFEAVRFREPAEAARIAARLKDLVEHVRGHGEAGLGAQDELLATFCCRVLGRVNPPGAVALLAEWLAVVRREALVVEAGLALCNTRSPQAHVPLSQLISRVGANSHAWRRIQPAFGRVPEPALTPGGADETAQRVERARSRLLRGDLDAALADLNTVLETAPGRIDARNLRALAHQGKRRFAAAEADCSFVLDRKPDDLDSRVNRGTARMSLERVAEALADFEHAVRVSPKHVTALSNMGNALRELGRHTEAIKAYGRALAVDPRYENALGGRGLSRRALGDLTGAIADFDTLLKQNPRRTLALATRGLLRQGRGDHPGAIDDFTRALVLSPGSAAVHAARGQSRFQTGQLDAAIADFDAAIRIAPQSPANWLSRAIANRRRGRPKDALADLDRCLAITPNPSARDAHHQRAILRLAARDATGALRDLDAAIAIDSRYAPAYDTRGTLLRSARRDLPAALADFRRAVALAPKMWSAVANLGIALAESGDIPAGLARLREALPLAPPAQRPRMQAMIRQLEKRKH